MSNLEHLTLVEIPNSLQLSEKWKQDFKICKENFSQFYLVINSVMNLQYTTQKGV